MVAKQDINNTEKRNDTSHQKVKDGDLNLSEPTKDTGVPVSKPMSQKDISSGPLAVAKLFVNLFSTVGQREPPFPSKTKHVRLITIRASHYCEKARWALDLCEADENSPYYYTEDAHPPPFQAYSTLKETNSSSTPIALLEQSNDVDNDNNKHVTVTSTNTNNHLCLPSSHDIIEFFCPQLYCHDNQSHADAIRAMEADLDQRLGPTVRIVAYHYMLQERIYHKPLVVMSTQDTSNIEANLFKNMLPRGIDDGMREAMGISAETAQISMDILRQVFDEYSKILEHQDYLVVKDSFTAADLAFAALAGPLIRPPELSAFTWSCDEELPPPLVELGKELKATRAGQHVLKIYANHRFSNHATQQQEPKEGNDKSVQVQKVTVKTAPRDTTPWKKLFCSTSR